MTSVSITVCTFCHKRKSHRKLAVNKIFKETRNIKIIKRKAPDNQIGSKLFFNNHLHIVFDYTFSRSCIPTGKTSPAGSNCKRGKLKLVNFYRISVCFINSFYAFNKTFCQPQRIASFTFRASVNQKYFHIQKSPLLFYKSHFIIYYIIFYLEL